jgi:hypothetical protein
MHLGSSSGCAMGKALWCLTPTAGEQR